MWLIVSSLSPHNQYLLFCCILLWYDWSLWCCFVLLSLYSIFYTSFNWSLSDKSPQFSRILLSIITDFSNAVVKIASIFPLITSWPCLFPRFLGIVPRPPTTIGIAVIFMFKNFFRFQPRSKYSSNFVAFFYFHCSLLAQQNQLVFFFFLLLLLLLFIVDFSHQFWQ